jgi:hypothetical protein
MAFWRHEKGVRIGESFATRRWTLVIEVDRYLVKILAEKAFIRLSGFGLIMADKVAPQMAN